MVISTMPSYGHNGVSFSTLGLNLHDVKSINFPPPIDSLYENSMYQNESQFEYLMSLRWDEISDYLTFHIYNTSEGSNGSTGHYHQLLYICQNSHFNLP